MRSPFGPPSQAPTFSLAALLSQTRGSHPSPPNKNPATGAGLVLAGGLGFEPRLVESESTVLPLDDPPIAA